jgi:thiamine kinase-like enzyme
VQNRQQHRQELSAFLAEHFPRRRWELTLPSSGRGHESYIAQSEGETYFIKLGAHVSHYEVMASLELTPPLIKTGCLEDDISVIVQAYIPGRNPSWQDFRQYLEKIAAIVNKTHQSQDLKNVLPEMSSGQYKDVGLAAFWRVKQKWEQHRLLVSAEAGYVDQTLVKLEQDVRSFVGSGLVASHNDICNANWLIATDGKIYLVDIEAMSRDDPAYDIGSLLWWYYPPALRRRFLERAGHPYNEVFKNRMRVRMALHCLDIILPRGGSFDRFDAGSFAESLTDFRAVVEGRENPRGYDD